MNGSGHRVPQLLARGRELLARERGRDAADLFGRLLLLDPRNRAARAGLARARALAVEEERRREVEAVSADPTAAGATILLAARLPQPAAAAEAPPAEAPRTSSRAMFTLACGLIFVFLGVGVRASWDRLVVQLARVPAPSSGAAPPASLLPAVSTGDRAVAEARRLIEHGDARGAVAVLERVPPQEPAYPLARRLRDQAEGSSREHRDR